jgi:hypothetical protein
MPIGNKRSQQPPNGKKKEQSYAYAAVEFDEHRMVDGERGTRFVQSHLVRGLPLTSLRVCGLKMSQNLPLIPW